MKLTSNQIDGLVSALRLTRDTEIDCNECLSNVAEYAEHQLTGKPIPDVLSAIAHHLTICPECNEEYEELKNAIRALEED